MWKLIGCPVDSGTRSLRNGYRPTRWEDGKNLFLRGGGRSGGKGSKKVDGKGGPKGNKKDGGKGVGKRNPVDTEFFYEVEVRSLNVSWIRSRKAVVETSTFLPRYVYRLRTTARARSMCAFL
jgi:hypothetical protein